MTAAHGHLRAGTNGEPHRGGAGRRLGTLLMSLAIMVSSVACADDAGSLIGHDALLTRLAAQDAALVVLDVRSAAEFAESHVPGARNISHDELGARLGELAGSRDKDLVIYCRSGRRTGLAMETLREAGFTRLFHLQGDFQAWVAAGHDIERPAAGDGG